ncbi:MAG: hypothetical protein ABIJ97_14980 [Bacteroidota bacterium]
MEKRYCLACNEPLSGRIDKKFCSDYCRGNYNNNQNKDANNYIRTINYILRKNRRILKDLNPDGKKKILRTKLEAAGFNFEYFTNVYTTQKGNIYHFCYDQGYIVIDNEYLALVENINYKKSD